MSSLQISKSLVFKSHVTASQSDSLLLCKIPRTSLLHLIISVGMVLSCHSLKSRTPNMWLTNTSVIYKSIWKSDNFSQSQGHKTSLKGCSQSWYSPQKKILMYKNVESVPLLIIEPLRFKEKKKAFLNDIISRHISHTRS